MAARAIRSVGTVGAILMGCVFFPRPGLGQAVSCHLSPQANNSFVGECHWGETARTIELSRSAGTSDALWLGTIQFPDGPRPVEISTYQYSVGPRLIVRTGAWHELNAFSVSGDGLRLAWSEEVEAPPSELDLAILGAARELLVDESVWDREDDRNCENDGSRISLYCALARATAEKMGGYQHRQPAMQAVRRVIAREWPERVVDHRLMNFNNDARTTLADVHRLLDLAEAVLRQSIR